MRTYGLALLVAAAGCNQVLGIKDTEKRPDAAPPVFTGNMRWAAARTVNGAPMGVDVFPIGGEAVDSDPLSLKVGSGFGSNDLSDALYDTTTGEFHFGFTLAGQPWRLVYKLPNDPVTREIQWTVQTPDIVIPRMTRMGATPPPDASGYSIQPTPSASFALPYVATSGAFTASFAPTFTTSQISYTLATDATPINGPLAAPDPTDWVFASDWSAASSTAMQLVGWGATTGVSLMAGSLSPVSPTWVTSGLIGIAPTPVLGSTRDRIRNALGALASDDSNNPYTPYPHMAYGISPNLEVYGFVEPPADCGTTIGMPRTDGVDCLSRPAMIPLADDTAFDPLLRVPRLDTIGIPNPPVMYARLTIARPIHGVTLTSGIQSLVRAPSPPVANEMVDVLSTSIATAAMVDQITLDGADLSGTTGPTSPDVDVAAGAMVRTLSFHPRLGADGAPLAGADDFVITLYQIQNPDTSFAKLHAIRVFHVIDYMTGVKLEGGLLTPGLYVFSITSRVGLPNASKGDFKTVKYPLGESTAFSRQFIVH